MPMKFFKEETKGANNLDFNYFPIELAIFSVKVRGHETQSLLCLRMKEFVYYQRLKYKYQ